MMAAITAARAGAKVLLIEKLNRLGKKILATGNGKCNFTNSHQEPDCYRGEDKNFIWEAIQQFTHQDVLETFHEMGIMPREREGYFYPASGQAASVLDALIRQLEKYQVEVHCGEQVLSLEPKSGSQKTKNKNTVQEGSYKITTSKGSYLARKVILATGGKAAPVHGTTGDGYELAGQLGLTVIPPLPALTSCILKGNFMREWTGVRVQGSVSLYGKQSELLAQDSGELQMVAYGISGIPVFQISRFAAKALEQGDKPYLLMDVMPEYSAEEIEEEILHRRKMFPDWSALDALDGMMHRKLASVLLHSLGMDEKQKAEEWTNTDVYKIAHRIKEWKLGISAVSGFDKAQVTCGGIATCQLECHTMETKAYPGLYLTGELLDVDGICGGYNLQWAWTSGYLAGKAAAEERKFVGSK